MANLTPKAKAELTGKILAGMFAGKVLGVGSLDRYLERAIYLTDRILEHYVEGKVFKPQKEITDRTMLEHPRMIPTPSTLK